MIDRTQKVDKPVSEMTDEEIAQEALRAHYETVLGTLDTVANSAYQAELAGANPADIEAAYEQAVSDDEAEFDGEDGDEPEAPYIEDLDGAAGTR